MRTLNAGPLAPVAAATRALVIALGTAMLAVLAAQVLMRYAAGVALSWSEEVALACFTWCTLLSLALGVRDGIHVRMDLLTERLPHAAQRALERTVLLATAALGAFVAWSGTSYVQDTLGTTSAAIGYPIAWLYAAAPACGLLVALFALERVFWPRPSAEDAAAADAAAATAAAGAAPRPATSTGAAR